MEGESKQEKPFPIEVEKSMKHLWVVHDLVDKAMESLQNQPRYWKKKKMEEIENAIEKAEHGIRGIFDELSFLPNEGEDEDL